MSEEAKIKSLGKALRVLDCFMTRSEWGVTELSEALGLNKSNAHDILSTFEMFGYLDQNESTGKYRLGYHVLELAHALSSSMGFRKTVYPHMKLLADQTGETVYLGVPDGYDVVYLDAAYPGQETITRAMLGERAPMYCTGIGKAILSRMSESDWQKVASQSLERFTVATITDGSALLYELSQIRARGYSVDNMEHEYGIRCVGVPVLNSRGNVVAGLSISGPSPRMSDEKIILYSEGLKRIAGTVSVYF